MDHDIVIPGFPIAKNQALEVRGRCFGDGANLLLRYLIQVPSGAIVPSEEVITWSGSQALEKKYFEIGAGRLISATLNTTSSTPMHGYIYAQVGIHQDIESDHDVFMSLCSGRVSADSPIAWPSPNLRPAAEGMGGIARDDIGTPAQGANWEWVVPTNLRVHVLGVATDLVTEVAVATRRVHLNIEVSSFNQYRVIAITDQTASLTHHYLFQKQVGGTDDTDNTYHVAGFPDTFLVAGDKVQTDVLNIQAYDQLQANYIHYEYWFEGRA